MITLTKIAQACLTPDEYDHYEAIGEHGLARMSAALAKPAEQPDELLNVAANRAACIAAFHDADDDVCKEIAEAVRMTPTDCITVQVEASRAQVVAGETIACSYFTMLLDEYVAASRGNDEDPHAALVALIAYIDRQHAAGIAAAKQEMALDALDAIAADRNERAELAAARQAKPLSLAGVSRYVCDLRGSYGMRDDDQGAWVRLEDVRAILASQEKT